MKKIYSLLFSHKFPLLIITLLLITFSSCLRDVREYQTPINKIISADNSFIQFTGRFNYSDSIKAVFALSGSQIVARFNSSTIKLWLKNNSPDTGIYNENYFNIYVDEQEPYVLKVNNKDSIYTLADSLEEGTHTIKIVKRTEAACGTCEFFGFLIEQEKIILTPPIRLKRRIEFIGNSITCGYGVEGKKSSESFSPKTENSDKSYASVSSRILDAEFVSVCYSGLGVSQNYDTAWKQDIFELYKRIYSQHGRRWDFSTWMPDVVVINLGTNDFALGLPDSTKFVNDYFNLLQLVHSKNPNAKIVCLDGPMLSNGWPNEVETQKPIKSKKICKNYINVAIQIAKAKGINDVYQFSLTTSGKFGYGANWHPNEKQQNYNAKELADYISEIMEWEII
ncbi:MAG: SGNH/GDSL hydrolase family protein [Bacteroidota bacterium]|nr:SGNH/GDSL hydrolase family protein [Bacteroidota bacterium]